jgi:DNA-binding CsgD family transcriptional regulator
MELQQFQDLALASDESAFRRHLELFVSEMGFEKYVACMVYGANRPGADVTFVTVSNTPSQFASATSVEDSRRDPVSARLRTLSVPFRYDRQVYESAGAGDLWEEQAVHGYKEGIAVAMHMATNKHFLIGMDRESPLPGGGTQLMRLLADLQLLAVHAQVSAETLLRAGCVGGNDVRLTPREREVLHWTMEGKSTWVIGELLSISSHAVKFHLKNAMRKLDSSSKHQAVIKAISMGLL